MIEEQSDRRAEEQEIRRTEGQKLRRQKSRREEQLYIGTTLGTDRHSSQVLADTVLRVYNSR